MTEVIQIVLPYLALASHFLLVFLFVTTLFRHTWGRRPTAFLNKNSILLGFIVSLGAVLGSLFYSEVLGFEPCVLCWWQRVFLYPLPILFGVAIWKKSDSAFSYAVPMTLLAALIATYQSYVFLGGVSLLSCTAIDGACSKVYVKEFGYITIPIMSLTASLYILLLAWANRIYLNENRNA